MTNITPHTKERGYFHLKRNKAIVTTMLTGYRVVAKMMFASVDFFSMF